MDSLVTVILFGPHHPTNAAWTVGSLCHTPFNWLDALPKYIEYDTNTTRVVLPAFDSLIYRGKSHNSCADTHMHYHGYQMIYMDF